MNETYSAYLVAGLAKTKGIINEEYVMSNAVFYEYAYLTKEEVEENHNFLQMVEDAYDDYCKEYVREECLRCGGDWVNKEKSEIAIIPIGDEYYYIAAVFDDTDRYKLNKTTYYEEYSRALEYKGEILQMYMEDKTDGEIDEYYTGEKHKGINIKGVRYVPLYKYGEKNNNLIFLYLNMIMRFNVEAKLKRDMGFYFLGAEVVDGYVCYRVHKEERKAMMKEEKAEEKKIRPNTGIDDLPF